MKTFKLFIFLFTAIATGNASGQNFKCVDSGLFKPQAKKIKKETDATGMKQLIVFKTSLYVNTDGSPSSYHPFDLRGNEIAINTILNAIVVRKKAGDGSIVRCGNFEALKVFSIWRDAAFEKTPAGYTITWKNVLAAKTENKVCKPCIFATGNYKGYFGSLTSLRNGLQSGKGECEINDQTNALDIPGLVLAGGPNLLEEYGAKKGDLLVAYNPVTQNYAFAIINDRGPKDNLGEGSVALNMQLKGDTTVPHTRKESNRLNINTSVKIAIIAGSHLYKLQTPYSKNNIKSRVEEWLKEADFATIADFIKFLNKEI
jgi:hypothetical protein